NQLDRPVSCPKAMVQQPEGTPNRGPYTARGAAPPRLSGELSLPRLLHFFSPNLLLFRDKRACKLAPLTGTNREHIVAHRLHTLRTPPMLEPSTDPPARSCLLPEFKTERPRFQRVGPDLSSRAGAEQYPARRHASRLCIRPACSI